MLKTCALLSILTFFVACSGTTGNSANAPAPKTAPQAEPQTAPRVETLSYSEGWRCLLFSANGETKDVFLARSESAGGIKLTLNDYDGDQLSPKGLELAGQLFHSFMFETGATLSEKAVVTSTSGLPLPLIEGHLQGTIELGFEILTQELITDRNGNLIPTPTMDMLATLEDCREASAAMIGIHP